MLKFTSLPSNTVVKIAPDGAVAPAGAAITKSASTKPQTPCFVIIIRPFRPFVPVRFPLLETATAPPAAPLSPRGIQSRRTTAIAMPQIGIKISNQKHWGAIGGAYDSFYILWEQPIMFPARSLRDSRASCVWAEHAGRQAVVYDA